MKNLFNSRKKVIIWIIVLFIILIGGSIVGYKYYSIQKQKAIEIKHKAYENKFNKATLDIISQTLLCTTMIDETSKTWNNAIYSRNTLYDFNVALSNLHEQYDKKGILKDRKTAKDNIEQEMINLQNPPEDYKSVYNLFVELYSKYGQIYEQATSPTGSLQTYNQDTNSKVSDFSQILDKIKILKPDAVKKSNQ